MTSSPPEGFSAAKRAAWAQYTPARKRDSCSNCRYSERDKPNRDTLLCHKLNRRVSTQAVCKHFIKWT
jgi:hypothetical protein